VATVQVQCFACKTIHSLERVGFRLECECGEDLHVCLTCKFYDQQSYNECREPSADRIQVKDRSNLCEFYEPKADGSGGSNSNEKDELLKAAEALFKS